MPSTMAAKNANDETAASMFRPSFSSMRTSFSASPPHGRGLTRSGWRRRQVASVGREIMVALRVCQAPFDGAMRGFLPRIQSVAGKLPGRGRVRHVQQLRTYRRGPECPSNCKPLSGSAFSRINRWLSSSLRTRRRMFRPEVRQAEFWRKDAMVPPLCFRGNIALSGEIFLRKAPDVRRNMEKVTRPCCRSRESRPRQWVSTGLSTFEIE